MPNIILLNATVLIVIMINMIMPNAILNFILHSVILFYMSFC